MKASPISTYAAYVDGSFLNGKVGYGAVILCDGAEAERLSGTIDRYLQQRQVTGELKAVLEVVQWCQQRGIASVSIYYDYAGVEQWAVGRWQAKTEVSQKYATYMKTCKVAIQWHKVQAHSGDLWNDVADSLARQGALQAQETATVTETVADDPGQVAEHMALEFIAYLGQQGITATYDKLYNGQYARIRVQEGYFDLYNTRKRPLSPYIHAFRDPDQKNVLERHWTQYRHAARTASPSVNPLAEVEYYWQILLPYRAYTFDFADLARALQNASSDPRDWREVRYNFPALEMWYDDLRKHHDS